MGFKLFTAKLERVRGTFPNLAKQSLGRISKNELSIKKVYHVQYYVNQPMGNSPLLSIL